MNLARLIKNPSPPPREASNELYPDNLWHYLPHIWFGATGAMAMFLFLGPNQRDVLACLPCSAESSGC